MQEGSSEVKINIDQLKESQVEYDKCNGLEMTREAVENIIAQMEQELSRLGSSKESTDICNDRNDGRRHDVRETLPLLQSGRGDARTQGEDVCDKSETVGEIVSKYVAGQMIFQ